MNLFLPDFQSERQDQKVLYFFWGILCIPSFEGKTLNEKQSNINIKVILVIFIYLKLMLLQMV